MIRLLLLFAALLAAVPATADQYGNHLVALPDGRRLNLNCTGHGKITVLLEAGYQAWNFTWSGLQPRLEDHYRVCSYDRAGLGFSDPGPSPRDGPAIAADLDQLITAARLKPPFVLVGHSAGGLSMRLLADRRVADVIGMVLVDSSVEGQFAGHEDMLRAVAAGNYACAAAAEAGKLYSPALPNCADPAMSFMSPPMAARQTKIGRTSGYWRTMGSEYESIGTTTVDALRRGRQDYGDLPIVVLTAGTNPAWIRLHAALAARSTRGFQHLFPNNGHLLHIERSDAVASAVDEVVAAGVEPHRRAR